MIRWRMAPVTTALFDQMVQAIDEVDPDQVILFGSRARGDNREDSDVDLMVIESAPFGTARSRRLEAVRLWRALQGMTDTAIFADQIFGRYGV